MRYAEFAPPAELGAYVHCLWVFEGQDADEPQRIAPDGRCELILHWGTPYLERTDGEWRPQPGAIFAGQLTRPLHLLSRGPTGVLGVRFRSAGARPYVRQALSALNDRWIPIADAPDLKAAADDAERLALAAAHVASRLDPSLLDPNVAAATAALKADAGRSALDTLCAAAGLSPRALQRRFLDAVGVSPRLLASIVRFRRVFEALQEPDVASWTDAAQAAGYFDHPQMARDFRRFVGCTPGEFLRAQRGLAVSLVEA